MVLRIFLQYILHFLFFKEFNVKGFSDSQTVFFIGSGSIRNITWVIRIALPKLVVFTLGVQPKILYTSLITNFIHFQ